jgi:hypothetical protein
MFDWKAPMPRTEPEDGKAHFMFAYKRGKRRMEMCGQLPIAVVEEAFRSLIKAQQEAHAQAASEGLKP